MERSYRFRRFLLFLPLMILAFFVIGWVVMWLWNNVLAEVIHISTISFWQAWGLLVLSRILFGSFGSSGSSRRSYGWRQRMQAKWATMTPEERERFKERWKHGKWGYKPWTDENPGSQATTGSE